MQDAWVGEVTEERVERPRERSEEAGDDEREPDVLLDRDAKEARASLVLADCDQGAAERRAQEQRHGGDRDGEEGEDEVVEHLVVARMSSVPRPEV